MSIMTSYSVTKRTFEIVRTYIFHKFVKIVIVIKIY